MLKRFVGLYTRGVAHLGRSPVTSFFVLLALLFGIIALGHALRTPGVATSPSEGEAKETAVFQNTDTAFVVVKAKVKKESVVTIVALTPGVVSNILSSPGRAVSPGQTLLTLSNDYQSGSTDIQKNLASEVARLTEELAKIDKDISALEEKQAKHDDELSSTEEDLALAEIKKDRATRKSTLEQSTLTLRLATINDAVLKPKVFVHGTVQSIRVNRGDYVSAGQVLATISTPKGATTLEAFLDPKMARLFDPRSEARLTVGTDTHTLLPTYFSQSENENGLFSVLFTLSDDMTETITNGEYLKISLPLRHRAPAVLVPIDALFQDDRIASVLVERDGIAVSRVVTVGNIYGGYAEILSGLEESDRIILSRAVIAGDRVSIK